MAEIWPPPVRYKPLAGTLQLAPFRAPLATDMEDGFQRRRRSTTLNIATLSYTVPMTAVEHATFATWVRDTLVDGTLPFLLNVWKDGSYVQRTCSLVGGVYQSSARGGRDYSVSLTIDVEDY